MIKTKNLKKIYPTEEVETSALNDINLEIKEGEYVAIMGPSGCGKSTLLNILGLIDNPTSGEYLFLGEDVSKYSERKRAGLRKANIGFVFQSFNLIDELTVFENVELPLLYLGFSASERKKRVNEVLEHMQLMPRKNHFPQQLSGGQQQRVAVARAVVARPKLILADEPTGNLDSAHGDEVMNLLAELHASRDDDRHGHPLPGLRRVRPADHPSLRRPGRVREHPKKVQALIKLRGITKYLLDGIRQDLRPAERRPRRRRGRVRDHHGPLRGGQIDAPPHPRDARHALGGRILLRRPARPPVHRTEGSRSCTSTPSGSSFRATTSSTS